MRLVSKQFEENSMGRPYPDCDYEVESESDDQFADDIADDTSRECPVCHRHYQLRCVAIELYFESQAADVQAESKEQD